ncbi:LPXTG cell wall anchor domain-containing protein [Sulfurimonas aquatica]|uniref:LPXTG cell wall anchor domain-containing protein n=1 Tax=Sulfurimonas aquatica TaxID=2672570 RepID=A0A975B0B4_9BACT|nr:LPXTG cell wall anchor domain-containing protein [Sulfurimonas aquatica]QSZ41862.1 LPXTG cell wall anchor domain-containing protein [Sulfurimonas aquatica]
MIKFLLFIILPFSLYASKILSYNIYERTDRADVMITFDTPYNGIIKQSKSQSQLIIKLENASIESARNKRVSSDFLHSIAITPMKNLTQIVALVTPSTKLIVSKTADAYGLRLRFTNKVVNEKNPTTEEKPTSLSGLPTKPETEISTSYYLVIGLLIIGIIFLLVIKKKVQNAGNVKPQDSWLFKSTQNTAETTTPQDSSNSSEQNVSIRFQKTINSTNSVVMLDFGIESYLVLMGNSNILLDKFHDNKPTNQEEFESILQNRHQELEDFLGTGDSDSFTNNKKEPLQAYKERAASLIYSEEN